MSITDQFWEYAEEAILTASYDRSGKPPSDESPKSIGDSGSITRNERRWRRPWHGGGDGHGPHRLGVVDCSTGTANADGSSP